MSVLSPRMQNNSFPSGRQRGDAPRSVEIGTRAPLLPNGAT